MRPGPGRGRVRPPSRRARGPRFQSLPPAWTAASVCTAAALTALPPRQSRSTDPAPLSTCLGGQKNGAQPPAQERRPVSSPQSAHPGSPSGTQWGDPSTRCAGTPGIPTAAAPGLVRTDAPSAAPRGPVLDIPSASLNSDDARGGRRCRPGAGKHTHLPPRRRSAGRVPPFPLIPCHTASISPTPRSAHEASA